MDRTDAELAAQRHTDQYGTHREWHAIDLDDVSGYACCDSCDWGMSYEPPCEEPYVVQG